MLLVWIYERASSALVCPRIGCCALFKDKPRARDQLPAERRSRNIQRLHLPLTRPPKTTMERESEDIPHVSTAEISPHVSQFTMKSGGCECYVCKFLNTDSDNDDATSTCRDISTSHNEDVRNINDKGILTIFDEDIINFNRVDGRYSTPRQDLASDYIPTDNDNIHETLSTTLRNCEEENCAHNAIIEDKRSAKSTTEGDHRDITTHGALTMLDEDIIAFDCVNVRNSTVNRDTSIVCNTAVDCVSQTLNRSFTDSECVNSAHNTLIEDVRSGNSTVNGDLPYIDERGVLSIEDEDIITFDRVNVRCSSVNRDSEKNDNNDTISDMSDLLNKAFYHVKDNGPELEKNNTHSSEGRVVVT